MNVNNADNENENGIVRPNAIKILLTVFLFNLYCSLVLRFMII